MERRDNQVQIRANDDVESREVFGYGIVFNKESRVMMTRTGQKFVEIIRPEAVRGLLDSPDIKAYFNHDTDKVLAKNTVTMRLSEDSTGVSYRFEAPDTTYGNDLLVSLRRGDIDTSSFAFTLPEDGSGEVVTKRDDGVYLREIVDMKSIIDMSPISGTEAYPDTTVVSRSLDNYEENLKPIIGSDISEMLNLVK